MTEDIELYVTANISSKAGHGSLHVSEKVELPGSDFRTISRALERFHGFGERLRAEILGDVVTAVDEVQELAGDVAAAAPECTCTSSLRSIGECKQHGPIELADAPTLRYRLQKAQHLIGLFRDAAMDAGHRPSRAHPDCGLCAALYETG